MERGDRPYGHAPTETEVAGQIEHPGPHDHRYAVGDRVRLTHDYTFGDRVYAAGTAGAITEVDVLTYGATEGVMETLGARVLFDDDANESAGWAPYSLLEPEGTA